MNDNYNYYDYMADFVIFFLRFIYLSFLINEHGKHFSEAARQIFQIFEI